MKSPDTNVRCDLCKRVFNLAKELIHEKNITLEKDGLTHDVVMTVLSCPCCGKSYPVIMDDSKTIPIRDELNKVVSACFRFAKMGKQIPPRLVNKRARLTKTLDINRRKLADRYKGAFYQTEAGKEQLEYRYHTR